MPNLASFSVLCSPTYWTWQVFAHLGPLLQLTMQPGLLDMAGSCLLGLMLCTNQAAWPIGYAGCADWRLQRVLLTHLGPLDMAGVAIPVLQVCRDYSAWPNV